MKDENKNRGSGPSSFRLHSSSFKTRAGEIRTRDLLNPIQAHYQAVLRPEVRTIRRSLALAKFFYQWADGRWATSRTPVLAIRLAAAPLMKRSYLY
jgi:hypothetical protein